MASTDTALLLHAACEGDVRAADRLFPRVYAELKRLSQARINEEPGGVTISATGLVHEAYLKLIDGDGWTDRTHFMAVAARAMRQILTDRARARCAVKRGGAAREVTLNAELAVPTEASDEEVLAVDAALDRLAMRDERLAHLVELRFFGGLEVNEAADVLGISPRTAARAWARAKAHLRADLA